MSELSLDVYGWNSRVAAQFADVAAGANQPGRGLAEHRGSYAVATAAGEVSAAVSGRFRHEATTAEDFPAVGDWVSLAVAEGAESGVIHAVLPRATRFVRPARGDAASGQVIAANVDVVLVVSALDHDFNLRRLERYLTLAWSSGAEPVIVLNKADVCEDGGGRVAD